MLSLRGGKRTGLLSVQRASIAAGVVLMALLFVSPGSLSNPASALAEPSPPDVHGIKPVRLLVPAAFIDAAVQYVGTEDDGSMGIPSNFDDVAWFSAGFKPGDLGHAVFDGHVSSVDAAAVFFYVEDLRPGTRLYVTGEDGTVLTFGVSAVESYPLDSTPMDSIFGRSDWPELVLITCGGDWHEDVHLFDHRTVIYAPLIPAPLP